MAESRKEKMESMLNPVDKGDQSLDTYYRSSGSISRYKKELQSPVSSHGWVFKFTWIYPVKRTTAEETINKMGIQAAVLGNLRRTYSSVVRKLL